MGQARAAHLVEDDRAHARGVADQKAHEECAPRARLGADLVPDTRTETVREAVVHSC